MKKLPEIFGRYEIKFLPLHRFQKVKKAALVDTLFLESGSVKQPGFASNRASATAR